MSENQTRVKYIGSVPGADSNTYNLFTTIQTGIPRGFFQIANVKRFFVSLNNAAACTLKEYYSDDGGANWTQRSQQSVSAVSGNTNNDYDYLVEPFRDWKLDLVNSGSAQTGFAPEMSMSSSHKSAT